MVRTWDFQQPESDAGRPLTAPRRQSRGSRRQRNRFPFAPDSDSGSSSDDESTGGPGELACGELREEANIPLSHSLPACLGGTGMSFANRYVISSRELDTQPLQELFRSLWAILPENRRRTLDQDDGLAITDSQFHKTSEPCQL